MDNAKEHILSLSYGKDSLACLGAIEKLGLPLDRIVHAEVWATDTISADLPPMVEFKAKADKIIKDRWGIEVEHVCAMKNGKKWTYEDDFYRVPKRRRNNTQRKQGSILGFPIIGGGWCNSNLKMAALNSVFGKSNIVQYIGVAADEAVRIERHSKHTNKVMPLVLAGWTEADCRKWCEENDLLSPIYTTATRGGCWFCHNQGVQQLRLLRKNYPDLWQLLLKWDSDSPTTFHADGHTVHDFEKRFAAEDKGIIDTSKRFLWKLIENFEN